MLNTILILDRSLAVLDLETTGLNPDVDRVIQIGVTIHYVDRDPIAWCSLVNPGIPILNTQHKITDEDVKDSPTFAQIAPALAPRLLNVDICGYNGDFDIRFTRAEMKRANVPWDWQGHLIDPMMIFRKKFGHTLSNAYKHYVNPEGFEGSHDAGVDVKATEEVLFQQLSKHSDLPRTVKELAEFCITKVSNGVDKGGKFIWIGLDAGFGFGKFKGKLLKDPSVRGYLKWVADVGEFTEEVKDIAQDALDGKFPTKG